MPLFILTPFNPKWPTAQFKKIEAIIVRAASETKARDMVNAVTFVHEKSKIGIQIHNPWKNPSYSKCERYQGTEFDKEGLDAVLAPAALAEYYSKIKKK